MNYSMELTSMKSAIGLYRSASRPNMMKWQVNENKLKLIVESEFESENIYSSQISDQLESARTNDFRFF